MSAAGGRLSRPSLADSSILVWIVLTALLIAGAGVLYYLTRGTTFFQDEWVWVLYRRGNDVGTFLRPHNQHLSLVPLVIYKLLLATAGLGDYRPYRAAVIAAHAVCVALVFVYARRRVGGAGATAAAALILFLGPAWGNILWPFQVAWLISLASGIGALLMLDRAGRRANAYACALLALSLASSGLGLTVMFGAAVELVWLRRWRVLWIVAAPAVLYGAWWVGYQQTGTISKLGLLPRFVADEVASATASLLGLGGNTAGAASGTLLTLGRPLAAVAVGLLIWRLIRLKGIPARVLGLLSIIGSFWVLTAISRAFIGPVEAWASRYLYVGGLFVVLIAVELGQGVSLPRPVRSVVGIALAAAVVANIGAMRSGAHELRSQGQLTRAEVGAIDITRSIVKPSYVSLVPNFPFPVVLAGPFLAAERDYGSPAATPSQIAALSEAARQAADTELVQIHQAALHPSPGSKCASSQPAQSRLLAGQQVELALPAAGLLLSAEPVGAAVGVRRFAAHPTRLGRMPPGTPTLLHIATDLAPQPWSVVVSSRGRVRWCVPH